MAAQATTALQKGRLVNHITYQALDDDVTGLANRLQFTHQLRRAINHARQLRDLVRLPGRPDGTQAVLPAHDGGFWGDDDWRNWRRRVWHGEPERRLTRGRTSPARPGCAPSGTRPRDLRSSFVTLRVYEGVPLTRSLAKSVRESG